MLIFFFFIMQLFRSLVGNSGLLTAAKAFSDICSCIHASQVRCRLFTQLLQVCLPPRHFFNIAFTAPCTAAGNTNRLRLITNRRRRVRAQTPHLYFLWLKNQKHAEELPGRLNIFYQEQIEVFSFWLQVKGTYRRLFNSALFILSNGIKV